MIIHAFIHPVVNSIAYDTFCLIFLSLKINISMRYYDINPDKMFQFLRDSHEAHIHIGYIINRWCGLSNMRFCLDFMNRKKYIFQCIRFNWRSASRWPNSCGPRCPALSGSYDPTEDTQLLQSSSTSLVLIEHLQVIHHSKAHFQSF